MKNLFLFLLCSVTSLISAQEVLTPKAYRTKVVAYSQMLKQQQLRYVAAKESRYIAHTGFLPRLDIELGGTVNLNHLSQWNSPKGSYRPYTYQALLTLTQTVYSGGGLSAQKEVAKANEELQRMNIELSIDQIHYQSDVLYWKASATHALMKAATQYQNIVQQQYQLVKERFEDGAIGRTDLLMISTRLKEAELQYNQMRQEYILALQHLNCWMNEQPDAQVDSLYSIERNEHYITSLTLNEVLLRRADYLSTIISIQRSKAGRKASLSQYNPQVSFFLASGWDTGTSYMGDDVPHTPLAGINISIPVFQWGARKKANRREKALIEIEKYGQQAVVDQIVEEMSIATTKMKETAMQIKTAKETMSLAIENLDLATFSYNEGRSNMSDVLSAQLSWIQARVNLINAHLAEKMAIAEYQKVISER
ncbi:MAG: TolC family protein [Mediterranea massiliensis]|nr:TolC family protein [Mediterranea massiliensis]